MFEAKILYFYGKFKHSYCPNKFKNQFIFLSPHRWFPQIYHSRGAGFQRGSTRSGPFEQKGAIEEFKFKGHFFDTPGRSFRNQFICDANVL